LALQDLWPIIHSFTLLMGVQSIGSSSFKADHSFIHFAYGYAIHRHFKFEADQPNNLAEDHPM